MRSVTWTLAAVLALAGCDQLQSRWQAIQGGGGGGAPSAAPSEVPGHDTAQVRDRLGDALISATRAHRAIAIGRPDAARVALRDVRKSLADAGLVATLDQQLRLNRLDAATIEVEGMLERQASETATASATLVQRLLGDFDAFSAIPSNIGNTGGGGGPAVTAAPAPATTTRPAPRASFDELDPNQLLENRH